MKLPFKRSSLVVQVAEAVRAEILRGAWPDWIPSERELSQTFHVSRNTCRHAVVMLRREKLITSVVGRGSRVNPAVANRKRATLSLKKSVGILIPDRIGQLRPKILLMIDELREELFEQDVLVQVHASRTYFSRAPGQALEKLVEQHRHDCWVLFLSSKSLQTWFMQQKIPCLVSGAVFKGIHLPAVGLDYRAMCRHAVGKLIALGHRRLVFFNREARAAGDLESEVGFWEGVQASSHPDLEAKILYHQDNPETVRKLVERLYGAANPPTALLIANSLCYLVCASLLEQRGYRIPQDISLISRDNDRFLAFVQPEAARYLNATTSMVHKCMSTLRSLLAEGSAHLTPVRVWPSFVAGGSIGPCPPDRS
jgi:LacI family transcriptional regulator